MSGDVQRLQRNRPTFAQRTMLAEFLERNPALARGRLTGEDGNRRMAQLWASFAVRMNASGGCTKTWQQWRKYWSDKKVYLKKIAAKRRRDVLATGGGPAAPLPPVDQLDDRMLAVMGEGFGIEDTEVAVGIYPPATEPLQTRQDVEVLVHRPLEAHEQDHQPQDAMEQEALAEVRQQDFDLIEEAPGSRAASPAAPTAAPPTETPAAARGNIHRTPRARRAHNQSAYQDVRELVVEHEQARIVQRELNMELRKQQLELQWQQLELQRQQLEIQRNQLEVLREQSESLKTIVAELID